MVLRRRRQGTKPGVPAGRIGDDLNEGLRPHEDARHRLRGFNYEWWYFHGSFDNGYSVVAILWPMNYAMPWKKQCTVQLSIYTPKGECIKQYVFPPRRFFSASYERCDVRLGDSHVRETGGHYQVHVVAGGSAVDLKFEPLVPGWKPGTAVNYVPFPRYNSMGWLVPVPLARVTGALHVGGRRIEVEGHGYHDHNWGEAPIFHVVDNWHWGHVVSGDLGIIWSDITMQKATGYDKTYMFLLSKGGRLIMESPEISVSYSDWCSDPAFMHPYPGRITVSFGGESAPARGEFSMSVEAVVETQVLLEMTGLPGPLVRMIYATIAKPFYFRWRSTVSGWVEVEGERESLSGVTIHEQMLFRGRHPSECMRLYSS